MRKLVLLGFALVFVVGTLAVQAQDDDLILYFDYENVGATVENLAARGLDGTVVGTITVEPGKRGNAARFADGAYIDLDGPSWAGDDIPREGMSLLAWINLEDTGGHHAIFNARANDGTWVIHPEARNNGGFRWLLRENGGTTIFDIRAGAWTPGEWTHFAGVYDSTAGKAILYINGVEVGSADGSALVAEDWGQGARVGKNIDDARPFTGLMDDLNIWKRGLTADEVVEIMNNGPISGVTAVSPRGKLATTWATIKSN